MDATNPARRVERILAAAAVVAWVALAAVPPIALAQTDETARAATSQPAIPSLPFADNPDPAACGIPQAVGDGETATLHGIWKGELVQPIVFLYDSHLRREVTGRAPSGIEVDVVLFQDNPVLNYYFVEARLDDGTVQKGWVPAPFLQFEAR